MKKAGLLFFTFLILAAFPSFSLAQESIPSPGFIAYIGADYNVYTLAQPGTANALTTDAAVTQTTQQIYQWPTWATDGQLAYFRSSVDASGSPTTEIFVSPDAKTPGISAYVGTGEAFTYANWSPKPCGADCRNLAILLSNPGGLSVKLIRWENGLGTSTDLGVGAPFYYNWSPEGARMIWQRNNETIDIYDAASHKITTTLPQIPGAMFTPAWSPVDDRLLLGVKNQAGANSTDLVILSNGEVKTLAAGEANPIWFSWSPDGKQVAYIDRQGPLIVLDAASGQKVTQSAVDKVLAFFWSPDSQHIAYITPPQPSGSFTAAKRSTTAIIQPANGLAWSVLDVASGANRHYGPFVPTDELAYLLVYFDQFAVSHHVWSPDSREIVYSEVTAERHQVISVLDTTQAVTAPLVVANGVIGIWSFN